MRRETKLKLWALIGLLNPSFWVWLTGFDLPDERGWGMTGIVFSSIFCAFAAFTIADDFVKGRS